MELQSLVALLRLLGDPTRLRLLAALVEAELTVSEITRITGLSQPRVSRHLKLLAERQLALRTPDQTHVYYRAAAAEPLAGLLRGVLSMLAPNHEVLRGDQERLGQILTERQHVAVDLLARMGVQPLKLVDADQVARSVERLLAGAGADSRLGDVLDVGTGTGSMLVLLAPRAERAVGVDISPQMRLIARAAVAGARLGCCTVMDGDMYALPFPTGSFDVVSLDRVLGTAERPQQAVAEALRVLRPGGLVATVEMAGSAISRQALNQWLEAGLAEHRGFDEIGSQAAWVNVARLPAANSVAA